MKTNTLNPHARSFAVAVLFVLAGATAVPAEIVLEKQIEPPHTGFIDFDPEKRTYESGERIDIEARPRGRFSFREWGGALPADATNPYEEFEVGEVATVVAHFEAGYLSDRPLLSPRRNVVYAGHPRDLWFTVHRNQHELLAVEHAGEPILHERMPLDTLDDSEPLPDSLMVRIPAETILDLGPGRHAIAFRFSGDQTLEAEIKTAPTEQARSHDLTIVSFFVEHGDAVLIQLPNGETLMLDTGTRAAAETYVVPFLKRHLPKDEQGRQRIDHIWTTHWHYDHFQGLGAYLKHFDVGSVRYNLAYPPNEYGDYDELENPDDPYGYGDYGFPPEHWEAFRIGNRITDIGDVEIKILNAGAFDKEDDRFFYYRPEHYDGYYGRNNRSLALSLRYGDFVYNHGGDIYQHAQRAILNTFPDYVRAHIYHANHHFHGGVDPEHLIATEPYLFLTSANSAVYDREAFASVVLNQVVPELERTSRRFQENLLSFEVGHTVIRIDANADWSDDATELPYETYYLNERHETRHRVPHIFARQ